MQEYPVKRGYTKNLEETMVQKLVECFGVAPVQSGDHYRISYGALKALDVGLGQDKKTLVVRTESIIDASDEVIIETNRRYRKYLDGVTGYSAKERVKKAKSVETK